MDQKSLSRWLKIIIIVVAAIGAAGDAFMVRIVGKMICERYPDLVHLSLPWMISMWIFSIPCFVALIYAWKVAVEIGRGRPFSVPNASHVKKISYLAFADSVFFFVVSTAFVLLKLNHFGFILASVIVVFLGLCAAVAAAVLSHLILKAALLQDENDLTI